MGGNAANAMDLALFLKKHPSIEKVYYPGLPCHPQFETVQKQMSGFGGMVSFQVKGGQKEALNAINQVKVFTQATSLGGVESLIEHRASVEGPDSKTPVNLIRASVGLEHIDDLINDLDQALAQS